MKKHGCKQGLLPGNASYFFSRRTELLGQGCYTVPSAPAVLMANTCPVPLTGAAETQLRFAKGLVKATVPRSFLHLRLLARTPRSFPLGFLNPESTT